MSREARSRAAKPRETKRRQPLPEDAFHRAGSASAFTAANVPLKQGADDRPLIAVSAGNFNTAKHFVGYPFGTSKRKISTIFYNTAKFVVSIEFF